MYTMTKEEKQAWEDLDALIASECERLNAWGKLKEARAVAINYNWGVNIKDLAQDAVDGYIRFSMGKHILNEFETI